MGYINISNTKQSPPKRVHKKRGSVARKGERSLQKGGKMRL